jgi:putative methylase
MKRIPFSKSGLAIALSGLQAFEKPKVRSEQYMSDAEIAAEVLWQAYQIGDIEQKVSADLGCGTGLLGIGMLCLGAKKVYFVDNDEKALEIAKKNLKLAKSEDCLGNGRAVFRLEDVSGFQEGVETVVQNPPFGTKVRHQDRQFLEQALKVGRVVYSFHKSETVGYLAGLAKERGFELTHQLNFDFPLKATQKFHKRRIFRIKVSCLRFQKTCRGVSSGLNIPEASKNQAR